MASLNVRTIKECLDGRREKIRAQPNESEVCEIRKESAQEISMSLF